MLPELLPREDPEVGSYVREQLGREGIAALTGFRATRVAREGQDKAIYGTDGRRVAVDEIFVAAGRVRSEEHTSELQSRPHLVCRLLLEKKKSTTPGER